MKRNKTTERACSKGMHPETWTTSHICPIKETTSDEAHSAHMKRIKSRVVFQRKIHSKNNFGCFYDGFSYLRSRTCPSEWRNSVWTCSDETHTILTMTQSGRVTICRSLDRALHCCPSILTENHLTESFESDLNVSVNVHASVRECERVCSNVLECAQIDRLGKSNVIEKTS